MDLVMVAGRIDSPARWRRESTFGIVNNAISFGMVFSEVGPAGCKRMACSGKTARITTGRARLAIWRSKC